MAVRSLTTRAPAGEVHSFAALSGPALQAYGRDGVVCLRQVFAPRWVRLAARGIERNLAEPGRFFRDHTPPGSAGRYLFDFWTWPAIPEFRELALRSPAGALAGGLLRSASVFMLMDNWFLREAGAANAAPWHQDEAYFDFTGRCCVFWLPLDPVPAGQGLVFVAGSHRWGRLFAPPAFSDRVPLPGVGAGYEPVPDLAAENAAELLGAALAPGDCLVFDFRTLHAAADTAAAPGTTRRFTLRFGAEDTRFSPRGPWTREISDHLIALGQKVGGVLDNPLTPAVWQGRGGRTRSD